MSSKRREPPAPKHSPRMKAKIKAACELEADSPSVKRGAAALMAGRQLSDDPAARIP